MLEITKRANRRMLHLHMLIGASAGSLSFTTWACHDSEAARHPWIIVALFLVGAFLGLISGVLLSYTLLYPGLVGGMVVGAMIGFGLTVQIFHGPNPTPLLGFLGAMGGSWIGVVLERRWREWRARRL
jgi:hypothetical protein